MPVNKFAAMYAKYRQTRTVPGPETIMPANLWHGIWRGRQMVTWKQYGPLQPPIELDSVKDLKAPLAPRDGVTPGSSSRASRFLRNRTSAGAVIETRGVGNKSATQYAQLRTPRWQEGFYGIADGGILDEPSSFADTGRALAMAAYETSARLRAPGMRERYRAAPSTTPGVDLLNS